MNTQEATWTPDRLETAVAALTEAHAALYHAEAQLFFSRPDNTALAVIINTATLVVNTASRLTQQALLLIEPHLLTGETPWVPLPKETTDEP